MARKEGESRDSPVKQDSCGSSLREDSLAYSVTDDESDISSEFSNEGFETFISDAQFNTKKVLVVIGDAFNPRVDEEMLEKVKSMNISQEPVTDNTSEGFRRPKRAPRMQRRQNSTFGKKNDMGFFRPVRAATTPKSL